MMIKAGLIILCLYGLSACGQTGPLVLPSPSENANASAINDASGKVDKVENNKD